MGFTFDGPNRLIILTTGTTSFTVKELYSRWKDWVLQGNAGFDPALRVVGGDPTTAGKFLGSTFFLINSWMIRPQESNHTLVVEGNLFTDDGDIPFVRTLGGFNVLVQMNNSNLVDTVSTSGGSGSGSTAPSAGQVADAVWAQLIEGGHSADELLRLMAAALLGKVSGAEANAPKFRDLLDTKDRITATTDDNGNRTAVTLNGV